MLHGSMPCCLWLLLLVPMSVISYAKVKSWVADVVHRVGILQRAHVITPLPGQCWPAAYDTRGANCNSRWMITMYSEAYAHVLDCIVIIFELCLQPGMQTV